MQEDTITLIIIVCCIVMSAYFSATETSFLSLNRIRIKTMAEKGNKRAALVLRLSEKYDSMLSTILIGNNIVNIACSSLATVLFLKWLGPDMGPSVSTIVITVVVLIFGEVSPKSIAKESPEKFAMFSAPILNVLIVVLTPFNFLFAQWKKLLSMIIKSEEDRGITEEEILTIVEEATQEGGIDEQESTLIRSAIEFSELEAVDILTPRIDIEGVEVHASKDEIAEAFTETGYSRLPVYEESMDHIIGIIYHKDFHNYVYHTDQEISTIVRPARFITKNKKIGDLLKELQQEKSHIAVVLDEFGGTVGIVTLEDILEELVGEIWDEHDEIVQAIEQKAEAEYIVLGSANVEKLFEELDIEEEVEVVTVSGWVMNLLERIPKENDKVTYKDWEITVLVMNGKRVEKIQIKKCLPEE
ncbi:MAG: HlyC/CorC family transporter [Lachnospiraceae bacterium]|nr:HlyC/CorC family transporter [Lachnospiraceae bacterium]MBQ7775636.1 HlyC/CorC family transporter [Lachnospiraceae bacterium]